MGVPAFFRWLSEKYPKIVEDVLEERVKLVSDQGSTRVPFDATRPNPSGLECDNLYIDMNGIIHPCSHPEQGPQPSTEAEMYANVCAYVDRLFRAVRPRKLLYLAIDGVAPRAKMNQQRSRRFRSAQEAREHAELEEEIRSQLKASGQAVPPHKKPWDSNVITPGTPFMLRLAEYVRFYIRKRISEDAAWKDITVIFSDASLPGEGEHKIMEHVRLQRSQPGYNPNTVHVLHGLDADLIMLALATHEVHFYILREVVTFGRRSVEEMEQRQMETGFTEKQTVLNEQVGSMAMQLPENQHKQLVRISIPILREYLSHEFAPCLSRLPFAPSLERLIDDVVFLCFFVGNDFLPHLPSLDIRDGALDFLFNVYKRLLPSMGDFITNHGGQVNLTSVDVILAEVGAIEDYVFQMKHDNEERQAKRNQEMRARNKKQRNGPPVVAEASAPPPKALGRAARILEKQKAKQQSTETTVALGRGHSAKEDARKTLKASHMVAEANASAAQQLKEQLQGGGAVNASEPDTGKAMEAGKKRKINEVKADEVKGDKEDDEAEFEGDDVKMADPEDGVNGEVEAAATDEETEFVEEDDEPDDDDEEDPDDPDKDDSLEAAIPEEIDPEVAKAFKEKLKAAKTKQLDEFAKNVQDKVRLHEAGWKDRYYKDKCKADDVAAHGGREHLYRSYVVGLCWVMKYYYDGCASWKWYYPFHYAPFASDLRNIERFRKDCDSFELSDPFKPVEQLMAVLPEDSSHAIPKASRWLMCDEESPIIDFYPKDVPVDPNGKAMPWLWVVLLPFIDEERLLAALLPTMEKWTKQELLCNAKGMDNGYLYVHKSKAIVEKLTTVIKDSEKYKTAKLRLTDSASYESGGLFCSVRLPLSNEVHPIDNETSIEPPGSACKVYGGSDDTLFTEPIEANAAVCVAFTEPPKLSHKSVVLPGAKIPRPVLKSEDLRIRRPRLNRGGGTIANLGVSNGASHQSGYGSMNISSYERNLALQTGRGNQMYQAGTRAWGAMEPAPKRRQQGGPQHPPYPSNPFNRGPAQPRQGDHSNRPPWQGVGGYRQGSQQGHAQYPPQQGQHQQQFTRPGGGYQQHQQGGYRAGYNQQQQGSYGAGQQQQRPPPPPPHRGHSYSFQGHNRPGPQGQNAGYAYNRPPHQNQPPSRVNPNVMSNLRSQLASTLRQNKGGQQSGQSGNKR